MPIIDSKQEQIDQKKQELQEKVEKRNELMESKKVEVDEENEDFTEEELEPRTIDPKLKLALKTHMGSCLKTVDATFVYPLPDDLPKEITLTLVADYSDQHLIKLGSKAEFVKKDFYEIYKKFPKIIKMAKVLIELKMEEEKEKMELRQAEIKNRPNKQMAIDPDYEEQDEDEENVWLEEVKVTSKIYSQKKGEVVSYKVVVRAYNLEHFEISFGGLFLTDFDILMIYTHFEKIIDKYIK